MTKTPREKRVAQPGRTRRQSSPYCVLNLRAAVFANSTHVRGYSRNGYKVRRLATGGRSDMAGGKGAVNRRWPTSAAASRQAGPWRYHKSRRRPFDVGRLQPTGHTTAPRG